MPIKLEKQVARPDSYLVRKLMAVETTLLAEFSILLAGGSVRKALIKEELGESDIDVFFKSENDMAEASKYLKSIGCDVKKHANCHGVKVYDKQHQVGTPEGLYIQLITKETFPSMEELLDGFDFTVCQFGYTRGKFYFPQMAYDHELNKQLSANSSWKKKINITRYAKYLGLGYTPTIKLFEKVFIEGRDQLRGSSEEIDIYADLYNEV